MAKPGCSRVLSCCRGAGWSTRPIPLPSHKGSVRARANKYRLCWDEANPGSCGLQDGQHGHTPPEVEQSASVGGNMLMVAGAGAGEGAQVVVGPAEPGG